MFPSRVLLMLGKSQFEVQKLVDNYVIFCIFLFIYLVFEIIYGLLQVYFLVRVSVLANSHLHFQRARIKNGITMIHLMKNILLIAVIFKHCRNINVYFLDVNELSL